MTGFNVKNHFSPIIFSSKVSNKSHVISIPYNKYRENIAIRIFYASFKGCTYHIKIATKKPLSKIWKVAFDFLYKRINVLRRDNHNF